MIWSSSSVNIVKRSCFSDFHSWYNVQKHEYIHDKWYNWPTSIVLKKSIVCFLIIFVKWIKYEMNYNLTVFLRFQMKLFYSNLIQIFPWVWFFLRRGPIKVLFPWKSRSCFRSDISQTWVYKLSERTEFP